MKSFSSLLLFKYFLLPPKTSASLPVDWAKAERQQALLGFPASISLDWNVFTLMYDCPKTYPESTLQCALRETPHPEKLNFFPEKSATVYKIIWNIWTRWRQRGSRREAEATVRNKSCIEIWATYTTALTHVKSSCSFTVNTIQCWMLLSLAMNLDNFP